MEHRLAKHVQDQAEWTAKQTILKTAPGVGDTLTYTLLADLPELGALTPRQVSALVGAAPINRDSGRLRGKRRVQGGRAYIWQPLVLFSVIQLFYRLLVSKGKHKKIAITACMRKFIDMLNAMVRDNVEWAY